MLTEQINQIEGLLAIAPNLGSAPSARWPCELCGWQGHQNASEHKAFLCVHGWTYTAFSVSIGESTQTITLAL